MSPRPDPFPQVPDPPHSPDDDPRLKIPDVLAQPAKPAQPATPAKPTRSSMADMGKAWGTALDFVFTILAGGVLGWLFDRWKGTGPTGALVGLGAGFVLAFYRIVRATVKEEQRERASKSKADADRK